MKTHIIILCFFACLLPHVIAQAQDAADVSNIPTSLTSASTVDDVNALNDKIAHLLATQHPNGGNYNDVKPYVKLFLAVDHKILIQALPPKEKNRDSVINGFRFYTLEHAVMDVVTEADIPALLDTNTHSTLNIIRLKKWWDAPPVTTYLLAALQQYQTAPPIDPENDNSYAVLALANLSADPKVNALLADTTTKATSDPNAPPSFLKALADTSHRWHKTTTKNPTDVAPTSPNSAAGPISQ